MAYSEALAEMAEILCIKALVEPRQQDGPETTAEQMVQMLGQPAPIKRHIATAALVAGPDMVEAAELRRHPDTIPEAILRWTMELKAVPDAFVSSESVNYILMMLVMIGMKGVDNDEEEYNRNY